MPNGAQGAQPRGAGGRHTPHAGERPRRGPEAVTSPALSPCGTAQAVGKEYCRVTAVRLSNQTRICQLLHAPRQLPKLGANALNVAQGASLKGERMVYALGTNLIPEHTFSALFRGREKKGPRGPFGFLVPMCSQAIKSETHSQLVAITMQRLEPVAGGGGTPADWYQAVEVPSDRRRSERQLHETLQS